MLAAARPGIRHTVHTPTSVTDDFNRADNTSSIGGTGWTIVARHDSTRTTTWGITSNTAYCSANATVSGTLNESLAVRAATAADFDMTLTIASLVTSPFNAPIACWRVDLSADDGVNGLSYFALFNGYGISFYASGTGAAGPYGSAVTFAVGDVVRIVVTGNTHEVYQNGALVSTASRFENNTATAHGLASYGPSFAHATFDDFSLTY